MMPPLPSHAALLVIDVQQGFTDPHWGPRNNPDAESKIAQLLAAWRATGRPIIHIHHDSTSPTGSFRPGTPGNLPKDEVQPLPGEPVYHKTANSAFIGTELEADLRRAGIDTLIIVGMITQHCVSSTTRMAGNLGFHTFVISDATATFDQFAIDGRTWPAADVHIGALSDLHGEFAIVTDSAAVIAAAHADQ